MLPVLRRLIREDIECEFRPSEVGVCVRIDPGNLEQVITNLAINARDAMSSGGKLTIAVDDYRDANGGASRASLTVSDTGEGIEAHLLDRVVEPFFTTKAVGHGTGLGLSTVHSIVTQSGGEMSIASERGVGTSVRITLPLAEEAVTSAVPDAQHELVRGDGEHNSVCEDDASVRQTTAAQLTMHGYRVTQASGPEEALEILRSTGAVDLLLTDVVMPKMSGYELADRAHAMNPSLSIAFMSGYDAPSAADDPRRWEGADVIEKPFSLAALLHRVSLSLRSGRDAVS